MSDRFGGGSARAWVYFPFGLVVFIALIGFIRVAMLHWREGSVLIGGALLLAALLRVVVPSERVGLLAIRGRPVDIVLYSGLGLLIVMIAWTIKDGPFAG